MEKIFKSKGQKRISYLVFAVYLLLLAWLVLFKLSTSFDVPHLRGLNLIPFYYSEETSFHWKEVLYNILIFVPAGVYFSAFLADWSFVIRLLPAFLLSLCFEIMQWVFAIGASDITDLIGNTLGGILGIAVFFLFGKISPKHRMTIVNVIGIIVEVSGIALFVVLLIANR